MIYKICILICYIQIFRFALLSGLNACEVNSLPQVALQGLGITKKLN